MTDETKTRPLTDLVAQVATAYVTANHVTIDDIAKVVEVTHAALLKVEKADIAAPESSAAEERVPSSKLTTAQWKRLIKDDGITSLIDNRSYKTMRRHLAANGLTPKEYLERYGLPADFPMVAPSYSRSRSQLAKQLGLGARRQAARHATTVPAALASSAPQASAKKQAKNTAKPPTKPRTPRTKKAPAAE